MTSLAKLALGLVMTAGLAAPAYAGSSNANENSSQGNGQKTEASNQAVSRSRDDGVFGYIGFGWRGLFRVGDEMPAFAQILVIPERLLQSF
jgi:hypothetical protein